MMKPKGLYTIGVIVVVLAIFGFVFHKVARKHVNYMTATTDHPLNCTSCHFYLHDEGPIYKAVNKTYVSPFNLAVAGNGHQLYVIGQESNELIVLDPFSGEIIRKIAVGERPHSVLPSPDGKELFVSCQWADNVLCIDTDTWKVTDTLATGNGPAEMVMGPDGNSLYVVDSYANEVSIIDLNTGQERKRLLAGNNPVGAAISPDGQWVYVTSRRILRRPYRDPISVELTVINTRTERVQDRKIIRDAYIMENVNFTPDGDLALATLIRPKNLIPSIQVEEGFMMTHGFGVIFPGHEGKIVQLLTDEPNEYSPDPFDVVITPDGKTAFISSSGVNRIQVVDLERIKTLIEKTPDDSLEILSNHRGISEYYIKERINVGANPKGMVISPDGKYLYVAERLEDKISVINTASLEVEKKLDLGGPGKRTKARKGRQIFTSAHGTFQNQYSCYTCHPDANEDGVIYNMAGVGMGRNLTNTLSLYELLKTRPYKWNGHNQTVYKQDGYRFSTFLTRTEPFNYDQLDALVAYIMTGIKEPPNLRYNKDGELTEAQKRGEKIFFRTHTNYGEEIPFKNRCYVCHPPPRFTNQYVESVGTLAETDDSIPFDTPDLVNLYLGAPYLHDGRAETLEEIWTVYGTKDEHGVVNDLTKNQLNDLIEFLKSIRGARYYDKHAFDEYKDLLKEVPVNFPPVFPEKEK